MLLQVKQWVVFSSVWRPLVQSEHQQYPPRIHLAALKVAILVVVVAVNDGLAIGVATIEAGVAATA